MKITILKNSEEIGRAAANIITQQVKDNPKSVLGLATGASPVTTYKNLIADNKSGIVSFKDVTTFNLDEYCSIPASDKNSYYTFMHENLFNHIDIKEENVHVPDGNPENPDEYCKSYDEAIKNAGGIDIQVLGIGRNGHIGFNEPSDKFADGTFVVDLTESTVNANMIYFDSPDDVPRKAVTMGVKSILNARKIILIAEGEAKAKAVYDMIKGDVSPMCPASILQEHNDVYVFLDEAAASML